MPPRTPVGVEAPPLMGHNGGVPSRSARTPVVTKLDAALSYARHGRAVFPVHTVTDRGCSCGNANCKNVGKHPVGRRVPNGVTDATTDEATIRRWWSQEPEANIGLAAGSRSGVVVLDVDPRHGGDESLRALEGQHGVLPTTVRARTGGGGLHLFFAAPDDSTIIRNAIELAGHPGLDVRGEGGYVVVAPSIHASGATYEWINRPESTPLARLPDWLLALMNTDTQRVRADRDGDGGGRDWLALLQGVPEGQRHDVAVRVGGHYLGRGWKREEVESLLVGFAAQCTPPYDLDDIRRIVADLVRAEEEKVAARASAVHQPRAEPWSVLAPEALYGLAGDIVRTITQYSEADPVAILMNVLVPFGNMIGPHAHFTVEETKHPGRLFAGLVGDTAKGRKGTSWSTPRKIFRTVDDTWCVTGGLSSGEGLINAVRDQRTEVRPVKEGGRVVDYQDVLVDRGVCDKRLQLLEEELSQALKVMSREGNILSPTLRQAWDSGDLNPLTKTNPIKATGAHICIIAHITRDELVRCLTETDQANGFANRFLWVLVRRSKTIAHPAPVPDEVLNPLIERLRRAVIHGRAAGRMERSLDAARLWADIYPGLSEGKPGLLGAILARAEAQVMRLALLYALLDVPPPGQPFTNTIQPQHIKAALALWRYCEASARRVFGGRLGDAVADKILRLIRTSGQVSETEIHEAFNRHLSAARLAEALDLLQRHGLATSSMRQTAGRPQTVWTLVGGEESELSEGSPSTTDPSVREDQTEGECELSERSEEIPSAQRAQNLNSLSSLNSQAPHLRAPVPAPGRVQRQPVRREAVPTADAPARTPVTEPSGVAPNGRVQRQPVPISESIRREPVPIDHARPSRAPVQ